jgi:hypothetical protein
LIKLDDQKLTKVELQQGQPQLYEDLTKNLTADEQQIIQGVLHQADALEQQAQATSAAAEATQHVNGTALASSQPVQPQQ